MNLSIIINNMAHDDIQECNIAVILRWSNEMKLMRNEINKYHKFKLKMNTIQKWSEQIPKPEPPNSNVIYSCTYSADGNFLFVVISDILVVYNAENGDVVTKPTKAAKQPINCVAFAKDGRTFATASNDRSCVIWRFNIEAQKKLEPVLKLTQNDAILTLAFNPITHELFSGGVSDFTLYIPGRKQIPKQKYKEKIISSSWSADGQTLAFGTINGTISFRSRSLDQKNEVSLGAPVWCMEWTPISGDNEQSFLLAGCWDQTFYYFNSNGEKRDRFSQRHITCNPISINFHTSGEYFVMTGTDKKISLYSRDLGHLADVTTLNDWSWCSKFKPKSQQIAITSNSGLITIQEISKKTISSSHHELYARRQNFTDVIVQNVVINQKLRVKCKELVKKISIFKDKLAVLQNERLLIYMASQEGLKYSPYRKITKKFDCDKMQILNSHALFAKDNKVQVYNFLGELQRQWILQGKVSYLKTIGGPPKRQHAILGLTNGQVLKIFVDNSFPIQLYRATIGILKCDINVTKKKLAVLDENKNLIGFDLITQSQLFQQLSVNSFAWNSDLQDSIAFESNGMISIKTGNLAPLTQKSDAQIIGFQGFQVFINKNGTISVMDISQSSTMVKYVQKKQFQMAYKLACLGVPQNDLRFLGIEALQNQDFQIAEKCFVKLKDIPFIDLCKKYGDILKNEKKVNQDALKAEILAYQGKYQEAAGTFMKGNKTDEAIKLFCQLKRFDEAQKFLKMGGQTLETKNILATLTNEQASWALANGDWKQAGQHYITNKNYKTAIDIYMKENYMEGLIQICRIIDKEGNEQMLKSCANMFKKQKEHGFAKQIYLKMGDMKELMLLHVQMEKWEDAFLLGKQNRDLLELAKLPYANYLLKNDKYEDAIRAFKKISRQDLTANLLKSLSKNAVGEKRFIDAARQYWSMAIQQLKASKDLKSLTQQTTKSYKKFNELRQISQIYYVYNSVAQFVETPFFTSSDAALYSILNACRFIISKLSKYKLPYINASYIYYSLAKVAAKFEGYKTARACYDKLSHLIVNSKWAEEMELGSLSVRSKPFSDRDTILPTCPRCSMANPIISDKNACFNCKHPFIISYMSFETLPLVEFKPAKGIAHSKVVQLINKEKKVQKVQGKQSKGKGGDGWSEKVTSNQQILSYKDEVQITIQNQALKNKINETLQNQQVQVQYIPVVLEQQQISQLEPQSVYFMDLRKVNPTIDVKYYINLVSQILLKCCNQCGKFFLLDEYQFQFIQNKRCPFCNGEEKRSGRTKDIFDL